MTIMNTLGYKERREEINRKYAKKDKGIIGKFISGMALGLCLTASSIIQRNIGENYASSSLPFRTYNSAIQTLNTIKKERDIVDKITYKPEHIRAYLEESFSEERKKSLDRAIELVEKDTEDIKTSEGYLAVEKVQDRYDLAGIALGMGGILVIIGTGLYVIGSQRKINKKRDMELVDLEAQR